MTDTPTPSTDTVQRTPVEIGTEIVEQFAWTANVMFQGHLVGQQYAVAAKIAEAIIYERFIFNSELTRARERGKELVEKLNRLERRHKILRLAVNERATLLAQIQQKDEALRKIRDMKFNDCGIADVAERVFEMRQTARDALSPAPQPDAAPACEDDDNQLCEACDKKFPIEQMTMGEDGWFCPECVAEWQAAASKCKHEWEDFDGDKVCQKCSTRMQADDEEDRSASPLPADDVISRTAAIKVAEEMRDKHSSPTGDQYSQGVWDQSQRIIGKLRAAPAANLLRQSAPVEAPASPTDAAVKALVDRLKLARAYLVMPATSNDPYTAEKATADLEKIDATLAENGVG